ncbi:MULTISPECIES: hypothetical protein [Rhizobium]|uniref:DUF3329 domain-containing protein n=1 Tax=Rhizobium metallidurans TaxID=1265931 RepID=A0A7W6CTF2_9HYPH|nr:MULTISPECIES: hypothetical protein [Rhizobium]MBB3966842.1 hypothetical protein [Rhizobium metallidurans]
MQLIDPSHPAYRALWVRVLIVVVCLSWTGIEAIWGDPFWAVLAAGAGVYAAYMLLWRYKAPDPAAEKAPEPVATRDDRENDA